MHRFLIGVILAGTLLTGSVWASGYEIPEVGTRAMSMAMAYTSIADDPSAIWFNPAAMTHFTGTIATSGMTAISIPRSKFTGRTAGSPAQEVVEEAKADLFTPYFMYFVTDLGMEKLRLGLGVNSPFGLAKRWEAGSTFASDIISIAVEPVFVNPNIAYQVTPCVSVAAGFTFARTTVKLMQAPYNHLVETDGDYDFNDGDRLFLLDMEAISTGMGFNAAVKGSWLEGKLNLGVSYRSKIDIEFDDGDASISDISSGYLPVDVTGDGIPDPVPVSTALFGTSGLVNADDTGKTDLPFPGLLRFGISYRVIDPLLLAFDFHMTQWSAYEELAIEFDTFTSLSKVKEKNWEDSNAIRFGALYSLSEMIDLGAGLVFDSNPVPDETLGPELPGADRTGLTFGFTVNSGDLPAFSFAFMHLMFDDRDVDNLELPSAENSGIATGQTGTYEASANLFSVSLTHTF